MAKSFKYKKLFQDLTNSILGGEFAIGDRLPTEKELAVRYQVSVHTVRQAMMQLKLNGIVKQVAGSGTYLLRRPGQPDQELRPTTANSRNIGVVVWNTSVHVFPRIIHSVEQEIFQAGYHVIACSTEDDPDHERQIFESLVNQQISGLIVSPIIWHEQRVDNYEYLLRQGIPFVFINRKVPGVSASSVIIDNESGGYQATQRLIELGHRVIGHLTSATVSNLTEDRVRGYKRALMEAGIEPHDDLIQPHVATSGSQMGFEAGLKLLDRPNRPTAVFCVNDEHSIGLVEAARSLGLKIPDDLSLVSFDNSRIATSHFPFGLDSVEYPAEEMGICAAQELLRRLSSERWVTKCICLQPKLIVRQSCAPYAGGEAPAPAAVKAAAARG